MRLPRGVRRLFRIGGPELEREVDDEIAYHFERMVDELRRDGMDEREALETAHRRFGDVRAYRYALAKIDRRGARMRERIEWLDVAVRSVETALRGMRRAPGLTASVGMVFTLGIGANATMFGVVDRLLLSPPQHVVDADAVRHIYLRRASSDGVRRAERTLAFPDYQDLLEVDAFRSVAAYDGASPMTMGRGRSAEQVLTARASATLFPLLGVSPAQGRFFTPDDDAVDASPVAVLAHEFWERRFGGDPEILGRTLEIGQGRYEVVGIAPAGFTGAELAPVDVWLPLVRSQQAETGGTGWLESRSWWWLHVVVRLASGASDESATAQATAAHLAGRAELVQQDRYPADAELITAPLIAAKGPNPSAESRVALWLAGVSLMVLLIACFNVANLLLARGIRVRRELAVRTALGVSRLRLLGDRLAESLLLAALGGAGAWLVARWGGQALHSVLLPNVAFVDERAGTRLALFLTVCTLLTALLAGFLPAFQASRADVADALRGGRSAGSPPGVRTRALLLTAQAAFSAVLLVGAGLFVTSLRNARTTDLGFDPSRVVVLRPEWTGDLDGEERLRIFLDAQDRLTRLPEVTSTARTFSISFWSSYGIGRPRIPGRDSVPRHTYGGPYGNKVGPGYFRTMGLDLLRGRGFDASDDTPDSAPVAVISESMAGWYFPEGDALGQCLLFDEDDDTVCTTVIGVVENFRRDNLVEDEPHLQYFLNQSHPSFLGPPQALMVRTAGPPEDALETVSRVFRDTSPAIRFVDADPLLNNIEPQLRAWRLGASMFTVFGILALVVAGWGLYSVLAFDVALRQHELGIRAALGAGGSRLIGFVMRRSATLVTAGTALGLGLALAVSPYVEPLLFGVSGTDPLVYLTVASILVGTAVLAGALPSWRAVRIPPREALEAE